MGVNYLKFIELLNLNKITFVEIIFKTILIKENQLKQAEKDVMKLMNISLYGRMCMNPLHFLQSKF